MRLHTPAPALCRLPPAPGARCAVSAEFGELSRSMRQNFPRDFYAGALAVMFFVVEGCLNFRWQ